MDYLLIFLLTGVAHGLFYGTWGLQIFEYKADQGYDETYKSIVKNIQTAPISRKVELFLHRFIGVFVGWMLLWLLLDKKTQIFSETYNLKLGLEDFFLFLLGYIGINGRLPSIAHTVERWFGLTRGRD